MSGARPAPGGEAPARCEACGATRTGPAPAAPPPPPAPAPAPAPEHAAPAGTHCEWCGAEFPDEV